MARKILVVEDSPDIARLLTHILSASGYEVSAAAEGETGWEEFQHFQPDLVILDVNLPGISGLDLCKRIRRIARTPVIMLTVQAEQEAVRQGLLAGADTYLSKPFEIEQLRAAVEYALRPRIRRLPQKEGEQGGAENPDRR